MSDARIAELEAEVARLRDLNRGLDAELNKLYSTDLGKLREAIQSVLGYAALPKRYRDELKAAIGEGE